MCMLQPVRLFLHDSITAYKAVKKTNEGFYTPAIVRSNKELWTPNVTYQANGKSWGYRYSPSFHALSDLKSARLFALSSETVVENDCRLYIRGNKSMWY